MSGTTVTVWINGDPVLCTAGRSMLNAIINAGKLVQTACGGQGVCHMCRIVVEPPPEAAGPTPVEVHALGAQLLAEGVRLSCQVPAVEGLRVRLVPFDSPQARHQGGGRKVRSKGNA